MFKKIKEKWDSLKGKTIVAKILTIIAAVLKYSYTPQLALIVLGVFSVVKYSFGSVILGIIELFIGIFTLILELKENKTAKT